MRHAVNAARHFCFAGRAERKDGAWIDGPGGRERTHGRPSGAGRRPQLLLGKSAGWLTPAGPDQSLLELEPLPDVLPPVEELPLELSLEAALGLSLDEDEDFF